MARKKKLIRYRAAGPTGPPQGASEEPSPRHPLIEPSLFYDPPYERPVEDEFAWHLVKYLEPIAGLRYQVKVETPCTNVWVDFVVEHGARRIGFEISDDEVETDPKAESGVTEEVQWRDALVIGTGAVDVLCRFRQADLLYHLHDALHLVAMWDARLFSVRGRINLNTLATPEARQCHPRPQDSVVRVRYDRPEREDVPDSDPFSWPEMHRMPEELIVRRLSRVHPGAWMHDYDRAVQHFGVSDDDLGAQWSRSA